jgi:copper chaperone NosL
MKRFLNIYTVCLVLFVLACKPESQPISYGSDMCEFCRMSIVDQRFGSEIVTRKGKIYKFDAVECMVNYLDKRVEDESQLKYILTNTLDKPGDLVDVQDCKFLISENMPSPMGAFINPFRDIKIATSNQEENSGTIHDWTGLRDELKKQ